MSDKQPPLFISYSRVDVEFVVRLVGDLKSSGAEVWLDQINIRAGVSWDKAIERAIKEAPQMLLVLSPESAESENVRDEINFAMHWKKIIVPLMYRECDVPLRLQRNQRIDFRSGYEHGLPKLLEHLGMDLPAGTAPPPTANRDVRPKAAAPESRPFQTVAARKVKPSPVERSVEPVAAPVAPSADGWEYKSATPMAQDEVGVLERLGQAGWEVTGLAGGSMTLRRAQNLPVRPVWQYHRLSGALPLAKRSALEQRGWTFVGSWNQVVHYFKRNASIPN